MTRIVQISDTHLGRKKPHFAANWPPLVEWIEAQRPDLVIHSGDVTVDGAEEEDDLAFCAAALSQLSVPVLVVPGNHDVGEPHHLRQPVDAARLARWRAHFGPDRWMHDLESWRLVGLNSMILGSGLPDEEEQFAWLEQILAEADGRRIGWFLHQPLFLVDHEDGDNGYWSVRTGPRARLKELSDRYRVELIATGHLHRSHDMRHGRIQYVWCPSSAFAVGPRLQPSTLAGTQDLGAAVYEFSGDDFRFERVAISGLERLWIDDVVDEVYPP